MGIVRMVAGRCGVRERRLGWFGHVVKSDEAVFLVKTQLIEVPGRRPLEDQGRFGGKICRRNLPVFASYTCMRSKLWAEISVGLSSAVSPRENEFQTLKGKCEKKVKCNSHTESNLLFSLSKNGLVREAQCR